MRAGQILVVHLGRLIQAPPIEPHPALLRVAQRHHQAAPKGLPSLAIENAQLGQSLAHRTPGRQHLQQAAIAVTQPERIPQIAGVQATLVAVLLSRRRLPKALLVVLDDPLQQLGPLEASGHLFFVTGLRARLTNRDSSGGGQRGPGQCLEPLQRRPEIQLLP